MLPYKNYLKHNSRLLRKEMTESEQRLWSYIRKKQLGIQFYRQKPIGNFIVDFYAPKAKLVVEIDGSQHFEESNIEQDKLRDNYLRTLGLNIMRFDNGQVLNNTEIVLEVIYDYLQDLKIPLNPSFTKGKVK
jgi:very-short-patch-repair endonuclease